MSKNLERARRVAEIGLLPSLLYRINKTKETNTRIKNLAQILTDQPDLSYILYFNHISYNDPLLVAHISQQIESRQTRPLFIPASFSHTDPDNPKNSVLSLLINEAGRCGIEIARVIQAYQVDDPGYGFSEVQARATYWALVKRLKELRNMGAVGCLISPEGHRSETGELQAAENGILHIGRLLLPVVYIPLAIYYKGKYKRGGLNIRKEVSLSIGETIIQKQRNKTPTIDELMQNLAEILPFKMRGSWGRQHPLRFF